MMRFCGSLLLVHAAAALMVTPPRCGAATALGHSTATVATRAVAPLAVASSEEREVSDLETAVRWIAVQGGVDTSILLLFAYDLRRKIGEDLPFEEFVQRAIAEPGLKFLILMPAVTIFFQILRRFGSEDGVVVRNGSFEDDLIVKYLGGAKKVRQLRNRWLEFATVKAKGATETKAVMEAKNRAAMASVDAIKTKTVSAVKTKTINF